MFLFFVLLGLDGTLITVQILINHCAFSNYFRTNSSLLALDYSLLFLAKTFLPYCY